jgi:hypothetical protein
MIRNFKVLGLALVAVLAMSAVVASAASAQFTANSYPTTVTATSPLGNDVFTVDGTSVECDGHFEGSASEASTTITIKAVYTNCKAFGFATATVNMNGCDYTFHSNQTVTVDCPVGKVITIVAGNCEVQVGAQGPLSTVDLSNNGNHIDVKATVTGITANATKDGFLCPLNGTGHKSSSYAQSEPVTVKPVSGGSSVSVDITE